MGNYVGGLPGVRTERTAAHRIVFKGGLWEFLPGGKIIDGTKSRDFGNTGALDCLRPGLLMGKITATGLFANSIIGVVASAYTSGGTSLTVSAAAATEIARRVGTSGTATLKAVGPPTANGTNATTAVTFSAVNTTTGVATVTSLGVDKVAGTFITAADGSETPITLMPDGFPHKVTDEDGTSQNCSFEWLPTAGTIISSQIINWPTDTSLQAWIRTNLSTASGGKFIFDDIYNL